MKTQNTYQLLVAKMHEVAIVPPQTVGPFTGVYKRIVPYLKFAPWRAAFFLSVLATAFLYLIFGSTLVKIASILQFGF